MGAVLNTAGAAEIAAELACCACSSVCGFVCKDHATRAKLRYCTILFFATIMCFVMLVPGMRHNIDRIPNICGKLVTGETCDKFFGFGAVYRVMLSMTIFYGIFAVFTIRVTRINGFRARVNNGFWILKVLILLAITIGTFFIPKKSEFFRLWMYACLIGGFVFMLYQIIIIIDFGHSWSVSWAEKLETNNSKLWYLAMVLATLLMFTVTIAAIATFYVLFAGKHALTRCKANTFYVTFIVIQCFLATVISVTPTVQQELAGAGLLQSSVAILYTSYLTYNTLSTEPDTTCNPLGKFILDYDKMSGINGEGLFGCLLTFALVLFACTVRAHTSQLGKYGLAISESEEYALVTLLREQRSEAKKDNEQSEVLLDDYVGYNYSLFHTIMALTSMYLLMILTNWHSPDQSSNMRRLVKNWASVWVQMASSFICILIYIWFLVTPLVRKLWAPIFGIIASESSTPKGYKSNATEGVKGQSVKGQTKVERSQEYLRMEEIEKQKETNLEGEGSQKFIVGGITVLESGKNNENIDNDIKDSTDTNSSWNLKRYKSIESIKSAFSSIKKRKSRNKNELDEDRSKIVDSCNEEQGSRFGVRGENKFKNENETQELYNKPDEEKKRSRITRFGSIESLRSGFSAISSASNRIKRKIRTKLRRKSEESCGAGNNATDMHNRESRLEQSFSYKNTKDSRKSQMNRTANQSNSLDETQNSKSRHDTSGREVAANSGALDTEQLSENRKGSSPLSIKTQGKYDTIGGNEEHLTEQQHLSQQCAGAFTGATERPQSNTSNHGSSVFKDKPQDPEVAREVLRLQWKILRMQAKVVKIQEKIIRIQAEDEAAKKNAQEAVEHLEPPLEQSSVVAGGVSIKRREAILDSQRKQQG